MKRCQVTFHHMSRRKNVQFDNGEIYHIVIRAIDGLNLFHDKGDFLRMIRSLFEFNNSNHIISTFRVRYHRNKPNETLPGNVSLDKRKLLVEIMAFCLMPNHVHLLVRQLRDDGVSKFMKKFGGYANFYNRKYNRKGHLFQDRYQAVHIKTDRQLMTAFVYIHTNPVAIIYPGWKERGIKNVRKAMKFLEGYRWSSFLDYLGKKNFPSITSREFLMDLMGGQKSCREFIEDWLYQKRELDDFDKVAIE